MKIIRKTKSVCPVCIKDLDANIIEENNKVYISKNCNKHGQFKIIICEDSSFYKQLNKLFMNFYQNAPLKKPKSMYSLFLTLKCNLNCPICYTNANVTPYEEPDLKFIENAIKPFKNIEIALFGGEATIREDLPDIIKCVEDTGNIPLLVTNGIKISNLDYLKKIKSKKLIVLFQFDGFDDEITQKLRGAGLLKIKEQALSNLEKLNIPSTLEVAVAKDVNDDQLGSILNLAVDNGFIKQICYRATGYIGRKGVHSKHTPTVNNLIETLEKQTHGRVSKKDIISYQKLICFLKMSFSFLPIWPCLYAPLYLLYRENGGYKPISELMSLDIIQDDLDRYFYLFENGKKARAYFLTTKILLKIAMTSKLLILSRFFISIINKKLTRSTFTLTKMESWLVLRFSILCEPRTFDKTIASNCTSGEIKTTDGVTHARGVSNIIREKELVQTN